VSVTRIETVSRWSRSFETTTAAFSGRSGVGVGDSVGVGDGSRVLVGADLSVGVAELLADPVDSPVPLDDDLPPSVPVSTHPAVRTAPTVVRIPRRFILSPPD